MQFYHRQVTLMLLTVRCQDGRPCGCSSIIGRNGPERGKWKRPCAYWRA